MLPLPFVIACLLGIGVLGFLLFSHSEEQQSAANNVTNAAAVNPRLPVDSPRDRVKSEVAKLDRSTGTNSEAKTNQAAVDRREATRQEVARKKAERKEAERQEAERFAQADRDAALREAARRELVRSESAKEESVLSTTPLRRDADQVKSATVAATTQPASNDAYSPENPDPSTLLAQVMGGDNEAIPLLEIDEPDTVMPPGLELNEADLAAPDSNPAAMTAKAESQDQDSGAETEVAETEVAETAVAETEVAKNTEATSVINGELKSEVEPPVIEPTPNRVVRIINPASNTLPVWFVTQKHIVKLKPGQRYETSTDQELQVRFARGGDLGVNRVAANDGDWVFSVTRKDGWELSQN